MNERARESAELFAVFSLRYQSKSVARPCDEYWKNEVYFEQELERSAFLAFSLTFSTNRAARNRLSSTIDAALFEIQSRPAQLRCFQCRRRRD